MRGLLLAASVLVLSNAFTSSYSSNIRRSASVQLNAEEDAHTTSNCFSNHMMITTSSTSKRTARAAMKKAAQLGALATLGWSTLPAVSDASSTAPPVAIERQTSLTEKLTNLLKRRPDISGVFRSTQSVKAVDRLSSVPVFMVGTSWGTSYMVPDTDGVPMSLYFLDVEDAQEMLDEYIASGQSPTPDPRIITTTLGRAVRDAARIKGVPTSQISVDGEIQMMKYKIVPSSKEIHFASKLPGKHRVGLTGYEDDLKRVDRMSSHKTKADQERSVTNSNGVLLKQLNERELKKLGPMAGKQGIPVFYAEGLQMKTKGASFIPGRKGNVDVPLYFSFNDLVKSWQDMRNSFTNEEERASIPENPTVEVFNFMDVVTSIDKDFQRKSWSKDQKDIKSGLEDIVFIPQRQSLEYLKSISARGNGKARLAPMR